MKSNTPLFDSLVKQLDTYKDLRKAKQEIIYQGKRVPFSPNEKAINLGIMFGFLKEENGQVVYIHAFRAVVEIINHSEQYDEEDGAHT